MFMDSFLGAQRPPHVCVLKDAPTLRLEDRFKPFLREKSLRGKIALHRVRLCREFKSEVN